VLIEEELTKFTPTQDMKVSIGVFDGVHLGHKFLISQLKGHARQQKVLSGVVTFRQHPQDVLSPRTKLPYLTDVDEKIKLLKNEEVDAVVVLSFTRELAKLGAREFIGLLKQHLRIRGLVIGPDFTLGRSREGDYKTLRALGREMNFNVVVVPPLVINGQVVSSTAIREALADGDMRKVYLLAGRFFSLQGKVVTGAGRGKKLGFPTANVNVNQNQALPADGIYATRTHIDDELYSSVTNVGRRPTFDGNNRTVEVYILDFQGDLYNHNIQVDFVQKLRDERKFDSVDELKKQMAEDVEQGKTILAKIKKK